MVDCYNQKDRVNYETRDGKCVCRGNYCEWEQNGDAETYFYYAPVGKRGLVDQSYVYANLRPVYYYAVSP